MFLNSFQQRLLSSNEKTLCCLCCASGPIHASFGIDRQGFVPGEAIQLTAEISNGSNRKIDKSYVELKMVNCFFISQLSVVIMTAGHTSMPTGERVIEM